MFAKKLSVIVFALLALPALAQTASTTAASTTQAVPTAKLVDQYTELAGSEKNAKSLVTGLRTGSTITLEPIAKDDKTITFKSPTGNLGNGSINIALGIAEKSLSGISNPTNEDLYKALIGDKGVLTMRADGMGWGKIANTLGFRLGEVMRPGKAESSTRAAQRADSRPEKVAQRPDRPERAERIEKPERPMRPERPERPERAGR